ncbi:MAG: polysaccharide deacetylase family protein [Roseobacter sp.]|jgi:hypothetical protein|nr:polysaccharide deacetylase family protein [Roseobacter sp.]
MTGIDFSPLRQALADLRTGAQALPIWWRDDDAITVTPALEELVRLAHEVSFPVHVAVIPDHADKRLAAYACAETAIVPLVHGWRHDNTAPEGGKKAEFGHRRHDGARQVLAARARMDALFAGNYLPVFVPPWNRFDSCFLPALQSAGFKGVSTFTPRQSTEAAAGIVQINTHVDPIDWHGSRGLADPDSIIAVTVRRLYARLEGREDGTEPLGYLTHHLVHTPEVWDFSRRFLETMRDGGAIVQPIKPLLEHPT